MIHELVITPRDPLIARDGRPFGKGQGNRMRSLDWPHSSTIAGSLRSLLGKLLGRGFDPQTVALLKRVAVAGPLPIVAGRLSFHRPQDVLLQRHRSGTTSSAALRPVALSPAEGCDLPLGLDPVMRERPSEEAKPWEGPLFWRAPAMTSWLHDPQGRGINASATDWQDLFLEAPTRDERTHVAIDAVRGAAGEGELFTSVGLDLTLRNPTLASTDVLCIALRVDAPEELDALLADLDAWHPCGGERRIAHFGRAEDECKDWQCPNNVKSALQTSTGKVRMVLATPAIFAHGWKPGWLDTGQHGLEGTPPGCEVRLRLIAAALGRWQPISGWSLEAGQRGPKPIRRLAAAGSVYFFETVHGEPSSVAAAWLAPVSDDEQDRRDGFGLATWGTWERHGQAKEQ